MRPLRRFLATLIVSLLSATVAACDSPKAPPSSPEIAACPKAGGPTTVAYRQVDGVAADLTSLDVHAPDAACRAPVVVWVHGGGCQKG